MTTETKSGISATMAIPNRSHWLAPNFGVTGKFHKEEFYPILDVDNVPRVGTVRVEVSADRYTASYYDEATDTSEDRWTPWRVYVKAVNEPTEDIWRSNPAPGVGPKTREQISAAVVPVVMAYLESDEYRASRQQAAAHAMRRMIVDTAQHLSDVSLDRAQGDLASHEDDLDPDAYAHLRVALNRLHEVRNDLNRATGSDL